MPTSYFQKGIWNLLSRKEQEETIGRAENRIKESLDSLRTFLRCNCINLEYPTIMVFDNVSEDEWRKFIEAALKFEKLYEGLLRKSDFLEEMKNNLKAE